MYTPVTLECEADCILWAAEPVGRHFREKHIAWQQAEWAKNNATLSWKLAAPLRAVESAWRHVRVAKPPFPEQAQKPPALRLSPLPGATPPTVEYRLSVIIPTFNAGPSFAVLLDALRQQQGFAELEIVVVDSGSTDDTLQLASTYDAVVTAISPSEFTHAHARNIGAHTATGDYFLFMTQDALPEGSFWARNVLEPVLNGTVKAATCSERPHSDADLYSLVAAWQYEKNLNRAFGADYIGCLPAEETYALMMQNAGLSNVACGMKADTFASYLFQGLFAEDLDFGVRLIRNGGTIGFLSSVPVIHSHNRAPFYYLKRSCVNATYVPQILSDMPLPKTTLQHMLFLALGTLKRLSLYRRFLTTIKDTVTSADQLKTCSQDFFSGMAIMGVFYHPQDPPAPTGDIELDEVMQQLWQLSLTFDPLQIDASQAFLHSLEEGVFAYLEQHNTPLQAACINQIGDIAIKRFAIWLGEELASQDANSSIVKLCQSLCQGV